MLYITWGVAVAPRTRAGFAAVLLVGLICGLLVAEVVEYVAVGRVSPELRVAFQASVLAAVGALVYTVHLNGGSRV